MIAAPVTRPAEVGPVGPVQDGEAWDRYVLGHPDATFFHLWGWRCVVERTFGYRPIYLAAGDRDGVRGALPLFEVRNLLFGRSLVSVPFAVLGGVCADDPETAGALLRAAVLEAEMRKVRYLELRNARPVGGRFVRKDLYVTFERPIDRDPDRNMAAIPRNQRRSIRIGQKAGLESRVGGKELLPGFYDVYAHSVRNLGTPVFPRPLFENLLDEFGEACRILSVWHEGTMVAAVMTFFFRDRVMPYYGGALRQTFPLAANDFMYWELMQYAAARGFSVFDFGRSKRDSGSYHFKRHWGFEPVPLAYEYHLVTQKHVPDTSPRNPAFSLPIRLWKRLPVPVTKVVGPWIARSLA
jgi:FemAB-related protein (PEP-CTERM system-associated)